METFTGQSVHYAVQASSEYEEQKEDKVLILLGNLRCHSCRDKVNYDFFHILIFSP